MEFKVENLTLDEKLTLLCGKEHTMNIEYFDGKLPKITMSDGPHGLRCVRCDENGKSHAVPATAMPSLGVIANAWNCDLAKLDGEVIADECVENSIDLLLAPGVNIKKNPLGGRNFEYFSEDPFLAGTLATSYIEGVQSHGVGVSVKHFCANNYESDRTMQSSEVDERSLREIYVKPFEMTMSAKPWSVMAAYNPVNGVYACENEKLLRKILRGELGYDGLILSDWNAVHNVYKSVRAGLNLRMPFDKNNYDDLKTALERGYITEAQIDEACGYILEFLQKCAAAEKKCITKKEERHTLAAKIASEGIVLLKNDGDILPLKGGKNQKIAVIGAFSALPIIGGGGSSAVKTFAKIPFLSEALTDRCSAEVGFEVGFNGVAYSNAKDAFSLAYKSDVVIAVVGEGEDRIYEGGDRETLVLRSEQRLFIRELAKYNENVILVIESGGVVDLTDLEPCVKAIIYAGYAGEGVNEALADIILGKISPSGKLAETFPISIEQSVTGGDIGDGLTVSYSEGVFVGYRYYDKHDLPVKYPFGFGLSYAKFEYSDLKIEKTGDTDFVVSYKVKNISEIGGSEVSQVYVREVVPLVARPIKELKGFSKDYLAAGEEKIVKIKLDYSSFAFFSTVHDKWFAENGLFEISVGASSRDIRLKEAVTIELPEEYQPSRNRMDSMIGD